MENKYLSHGGFEDEQAKHAEIARSCTRCIVEIGVFEGTTSHIFLSNNHRVKVYGIDPIIPDSMAPEFIGDYEKIQKLAIHYPNYVFIKDYSYNVVKKWEEIISYLFIDGDHRYSRVSEDFHNWFPFVEHGGIIALHDSSLYRGGNGWPDPSRFADELLEDKRLEYVDTVLSMTIFKKI